MCRVFIFICLKYKDKKPKTYRKLTMLGNQSIILLPIQPVHILKLLELPFEHNDPFDRLMIAQCLQDQIAFISNEVLFLRYGVNRVW